MIYYFCLSRYQYTRKYISRMLQNFLKSPRYHMYKIEFKSSFTQRWELKSIFNTFDRTTSISNTD